MSNPRNSATAFFPWRLQCVIISKVGAILRKQSWALSVCCSYQFVARSESVQAYSTCVAGIAATTRSHVKHFPTTAAYDDYYDLVVDIGNIGVEQFAKSDSRHCWLSISVVEYDIHCAGSAGAEDEQGLVVSGEQTQTQEAVCHLST